VEKKAMHEHIARVLYYVGIHLLFASIVGLAAWVLTSIRGASATTKYWIWVATSLNFIFPLGAIVDGLWGARLSWAAPLGVVGDFAYDVSAGPAALVVAVVWVLGAVAMLARLRARIRAERREARLAAGLGGNDVRPSFFAHGIPVRVGGRQAPAVDGILRPYISLPAGIDRVLSRDELDAVLTHEITHARRRDNLIRLLHELGGCLLWFHPLVWVAGSRLAVFRELSCDESVIETARGGDLVSALAKLAEPGEPMLLQSTASSFLSHRLARLAGPPRPSRRAASMLLLFLFSAFIVGGVFETVAHTACCFRHKG
jgi:beta-lactamase regulating signal transducer with metallopeptidase domain